MLKKWFPAWLAVVVLVMPSVTLAQPAEDDAPALMFRVRSFDTLIENIKVIARAADKAELGDQIDQMIKAQAGADGLEGIDTKRPWGVYARITPDFSNPGAVAVVPVSNEEKFLKLLANVNFKADKNDAGVYIIDQFVVPVQIGFRFAHGYAYVTADNFDSISDKNLIKPADLFPRNDTTDISASVRVDQIPKQFKDIAIAKIEEELANQQQQNAPENETDAQRAVREKTSEVLSNYIADFLRGGKELSISLDVNPQSEELVAELMVSGKKTSRIAQQIGDLGKSPALFSSLLGEKAAISGLMNLKLSDELHKVVWPAFKEKLDEKIKEEQNAEKRKDAEMLLKVLEPTFKAGQFDGGLVMRPDASGKTTMIGGLRVKDGVQLEKTVKDLIKKASEEEQAKIKLDVARVSGANIHQINAQENYDDEARRLFGDNPVLFAFREDAVLFAVGSEAMDAMKKAIQSVPKQGPALEIALNLRQLTRIAAKKDSEKELARKFLTEDHPGLLRFTMEGGPVLRMRFSADLSIIRFGVEVDRLKKEVDTGAVGQ